MCEDDLLESHIWSSDIKEELKADAEKWRATAGLTPDDISWADTMRASKNPQQSAELKLAVQVDSGSLSNALLSKFTAKLYHTTYCWADF